MLRGNRGDDPKGSGARSALKGLLLLAIRNRNRCDAWGFFPPCSEIPQDVKGRKPRKLHLFSAHLFVTGFSAYTLHRSREATAPRETP